MALTDFQRTVCRALARRRKEGGDSYVAGGTALGEATGSARLSRDIDLFHDVRESVATSAELDCELLVAEGWTVRVLRERPTFVEATVGRAEEHVLVQWAVDSAYRFFPLVEHPDFGLTLHPFDLATNKVLAMVGRLEVRDWIDVLSAHEQIQPFGFLVWAACGKDPGFGPGLILEQAGRSARYTDEEIAALDFDGPPPRAADLSRTWHAALAGARDLVAALPQEHAGTCVLDGNDGLLRCEETELRRLLAMGSVQFRSGSIRGVLPTVRNSAHS